MRLKVERNNLKKYLEALFGIIFLAVSLDLIISPMNIVVGGTGGVAVIFKYLFGIDVSLFVTIFYIAMILLNLIVYGIKDTEKIFLFSIIYPVFTKIFANLPNIIYIDYETNKLSLYVLSAILMGIGNGLIFKNGFICGGTDVIKKILANIMHISMGTATLVIDALIVLFGGYIFGLKSVIYAIMIIYLASKITDKLILGVGTHKTFYIITEESEKIRNYIKDELSVGITEIDAYGFTNNKKHILMTVIDTRKYLLLKEKICMLDNNAFIVIVDSYHMYHGGEQIGINKNKGLGEKI